MMVVEKSVKAVADFPKLELPKLVRGPLMNLVKLKCKLGYHEAFRGDMVHSR
jgi:hypothetical protein